ncbi:hypothetical protein [Amycolatopsis jiangsuensis]|uniref:Uncharacterized protein n=1 Tax=Amycolatopsis jiangsuensis TaxID=1181879 RepID=A0A840J7F5_9PSEU|nr:hypothetical protein [Amycolatopsis jiangsuensis]MBB4689535.1 hypothetical protein [Amycolatopsis jiangsuensis]
MIGSQEKSSAAAPSLLIGTAAYRFIADELAAQGFTASENRVWWICSMQQILSSHATENGLSRKDGLTG